MKIPKLNELFSLEHTISKEFLEKFDTPYEALPCIKEICLEVINSLDSNFYEFKPGVFVSKSAKIDPSATILPPTVIGHDTEVRPNAYIRGSVIIGDGAVIGNSTEIKNAIIFDGAQLPHYNYVGDSIIGYRAHLGAGAIVSNFKLDKTNVYIKTPDGKIDTGLRKMGVLLGDFCEVGCNCVICPGTIIGKESIIYPLSRFVGILPSEHYFYGDERGIKKKNTKGE